MERNGSRMFARIAILLTVVAMLCAFGVVAWAADNGSTDEPVCYNHGDVNGDGVIDNRDAIYTLYHFMYGDEQYPVDQDWDFNSDGEHSNKDAIYVLYASIFDEDPDYQLKGFIHNYYDPAWEWSEDGEITAQVTFKCGCPDGGHVFVTEEGGVTIESTETVVATCQNEGAITYVASIEFEGKEYTNTKTVRTSMLDHSMEGFQSCETEAKCANCDYTLPALGHNWTEKSRTEASCSARAVITYECGNCRGRRTEETGELADHDMVYMDGCDVRDGCKYTQQYKCKNCPQTTDGTVYYQHNYVAQIVPATCVADGSRIYVCEKCQQPQLDEYGNENVIVLSDENAHNWEETAEGSGEFVCRNEGCDKTKKTVDAVDTAVSKDALAEADELKLSNDGAAMAVDSTTLDNLGLQAEDTLKVTVDAIPVADLEVELTEEQKEMILSGTVYDFTMEINEEQIAEFGTEITISLPYELSEGEDPESIQVWYIDEETGNVESFEGIYRNGFVTFTTDHFSYYTVTRMTPAERCARYGHVLVTTHKDPTCTVDGYDLVQCQRCAEKISDKKLEKTGHDYKVTTVDATCTTDGSVRKTCQNEGCKHYLSEKLPALGHQMEKDATLSAAATCQANGKDVSVCTREGCTEKTETILPQLPHTLETEEVAPDCVNKGYKKVYCKVCNTVTSEAEKAPIGHNYLPENAVWKWSDDHKTATVILVCSHDSKHTKELNAVVSSTVKTETSCLGSGAVVHTAVASFNKVEYSNSVTITQGAAGHKPGSSWSKDASKHWHVCSVCTEKVDVAFHSWDDGKVVTAPTCVEAGETLYTCTVCGQEKTVAVKATGVHDYHYGICKVCGFGKSTCDHEALYTIEADMSQYGICEGTVFYWITCDCGENKRLVCENLGCNLGGPVIKVETDEHGWGYEVEVYTCPDCGLIGEAFGYDGLHNEECTWAWIEGLRIIKNGEVLIDECSYERVSEEQHPTVNVTKEIDISQYGVCGLILQETVCPCGQNSGVGVWATENGCQFEFIDDVETCVVCGVRLEYGVGHEEDENSCTSAAHYTLLLYKGDELVYSHEWTGLHTAEHSYELADYKLLGSTCQDGLVITEKCVKCGDTITRETYDHEIFINRETDLSRYGICSGNNTLVEYGCLCGAEKSAYLYVNDEENACRWYFSDLDGDAYPEYRECEKCGISQNVTVSYGEKDEQCACVANETVIYRDKNGKQIAVGYSAYGTVHHDIERTATLMGESCYDGVLIVEECKNCDHHDEWEQWDHYTYTKTTFDLSSFDMCSTQGELRTCLCGEEEWFNWTGGNCQWTWIDGGNNWDLWKCDVCGIEKKESYQNGASIDLCHTLRYTTLEFSRDGVSLGKFSFEKVYEDHFYVATELELLDEAAGCAGGVRGKSECAACGKQITFGTPPGDDYHHAFATELEFVCVEGLCGKLTMVKNSCACGAESWEDERWYGGSCSFDDGYYSEKLDCYVQVCSQCGVERVERGQYGEAIDECRRIYTRTWEFFKNGVSICQCSRESIREEHIYAVYEMTFQDAAAGCLGGVYCKAECVICGHQTTMGTPEGHAVFETEIEILCAEGLCGKLARVKYSCACGEESWTDIHWYGDQCDFGGEEYSEELGCWVQTCYQCGAQRGTTTERIRVEGTTCTYQNIEHVAFYKDGKIVGQYDVTDIYNSHTEAYTFELLGTTCDDGYRVIERCAVCGDVCLEWEEIYYGCNTYPVDVEIVCENANICGPVEYRVYSCACGAIKHDGWSQSGSWTWESYDPETGMETYRCVDCGLERTGKSSEEKIPGSCDAQQILDYTFSLNGEVIGSIQKVYATKSHTLCDRLTLLGDSCDDGYRVTEVCALCGYVEYEGDEIHYGCENRCVDIEIIFENENICGPVVVDKYGCACGAKNSVQRSESCDWNWVSYDSETGMDTYRCMDCGLERTGKSSEEKIPGGCNAQTTLDYTYSLNGGIIGSIHKSYITKRHDLRYSFTLLGESCDDGYYLHEACADCDYKYTQYGTYIDHENRTLDYYDLSEYGICGGHVTINGCACGQNAYSYEYMGCNWDNTGNIDPITGLMERYCADCDTYFYTGTLGETDKTNCQFSGELVFKAIRNGEVLLDVSGAVKEYRHNYTLAGANFDADNNCANGVTVLRQCLVCGDTNEDHIYHHEHFVNDYIDLTEAGFACGGELRIGGCACGEDNYFHENFNCQNMSWTDRWETGKDGIERYIREGECSDCGLKYTQSYYEEKVEGCCFMRYETIVVYQNGAIIKTMERQYRTYSHNEIAYYTLSEGSVTCEDGLDVVWICQDCGNQSTGRAEHHAVGKTDVVIDLTPYGSICGAELCLYQCPCGQNKEYRFNDDTKCDITEYSDTLWISDAINGDQPNADGHVWLYSYADRLGCGVTDPHPCGLELFRASYWLVEDCIATQYVTWRMGYDEATGTWDKEITVATGKQEAWHDYQHSSDDQTVDGTGIHTWRDECSDCGSYHEVVETWQNHNIVKRTEEYYNALDFGSNRSHTVSDENGMVVQSKVNPDEYFWMPTKSEHTWTRMDGEVFTEGWTRVYDFSGDCMATTNYWNVDGYTWTDTAPAHTIFMEWEVETLPTCTQFGELVRPCRICGVITDDERQAISPTMHNFCWDEDKLKYVCSDCGLESVRGYSGSIAMEDLTVDTGADYVIGYWNRDEIAFMPTVSVMLYDVNADELDELVLVGIEFTYYTADNDGFTGLSFNKAAAQAAADQAIAEAGYSGSYGIRISFVPIDTQDELDYAITFDTQTTAE